MGTPLLNKAFEGYNCCLFAYGQTGSGKSYSMMGLQNEEQRGIIPRFSQAMFSGISGNATKGVSLCRAHVEWQNGTDHSAKCAGMESPAYRSALCCFSQATVYFGSHLPFVFSVALSKNSKLR